MNHGNTSKLNESNLNYSDVYESVSGNIENIVDPNHVSPYLSHKSHNHTRKCEQMNSLDICMQDLQNEQQYLE